MVYRAIGMMSGSSLDGLDIAFVEFHEQAGAWSFEIQHAGCLPYSSEWKQRLQEATGLSAGDYQQLHTDYGHYLGEQVNEFMDKYELNFKVGLIASHGHTTFHHPGRKMTAQIGDGAAIAAKTGLPVVSDLRALDVAFGGQGAPIVPIGEKLLWKEYKLFLNLGGIANISADLGDKYIAYDVCPANRVLNMICNMTGKEYDEGGEMAARGNTNHDLLHRLNTLDYYKLSYPKSLANSFGIEEVYPLLATSGLSDNDQLKTMVEHIVMQVKKAVQQFGVENTLPKKMLVTGGGAFNNFLVQKLSAALLDEGVEVVVPPPDIIKYKEAIVMAFIGVLRWRQEYNVLSSVTGAARNSIGGALWIGQEA